MTPTPDADVRAGRLYGLPLDEFTAARNALAAELKAEGDREGAAAVRALRKPSRAAWAVNRLARSEPELVEALLGAGGELRQAHRQAASGRGAEQLRAAADAERAAVEGLMARAPEVLGSAPAPALADAMRDTLHAASSDDEARELVREGRLVDAMRPIGLGPAPASAPASRAKAPARGATRAAQGRAPARGADREQADAERQAKQERARQLKAARAEEAALRREADAAQRSLERAEESLTRARDAMDTATERAKDARRRARTARTALSDAERRLARIERDAPAS